MSEDQKLDQPALLPQPPVPFQIPNALIEKWLAIPERKNVTVTLNRQDIDNLFFAITNAAQATFQLQQTLIHHSHGRIDEANKCLADSQRRNIEGDNYIRMFMNSLMAGVQSNG